MTGWVILVDQPRDFPNADTPHKVIITSEYLARPRLFVLFCVQASISAQKETGGLYGVDLKETANGFVVMEVNDNPNLEHGIEDAVGKDEVWMRILKWFIERLEQ
jgi:hypothetical protein